MEIAAHGAKGRQHATGHLYRLDWLEPLVKGRSQLLVKDGQLNRDAMRQAGVSEHDLMQEIRPEAGETDLSRVRQARLERDGSISVVISEREPGILDGRVEDGVQTVEPRRPSPELTRSTGSTPASPHHSPAVRCRALS
jgi:Protein of unknown function (DUF421)